VSIVSITSSEILIPSRVNLYLADTGVAAPADCDAAPAAGWVNVGHTKEDSLSFSTAPEFGEVTSHQANTAIRRFQTSEEISLSVDLLQWNPGNLQAVYGGGTITEPTAGVFKYTPPTFGERTEKQCLLEVIDGTKVYRFVFVKTMQIEGVQNELQKAQEARLPLRLAILSDTVGAPWYFITNDPAFDPTP
jgi:hypothetical protein